ncbi:hypothetical protein Salat_1444600 [Sesamum alatum]|uniref:Reverse transcriptase domain-containing protein n=1 Tax=Sesamum alatum TaxID=300844 RepID=A0AAE1YAP2_9LAMI|nr:hypothetical protein Salat_1444600 [Sesamum alatum]
MAEYLSTGLNKLMVANPNTAYRGNIGVSRLAYVDHVIIFTNAKRHSLHFIMDFLREVEETSGQYINVGKSAFTLAVAPPMMVLASCQATNGFLHEAFAFYIRSGHCCPQGRRKWCS